MASLFEGETAAGLRSVALDRVRAWYGQCGEAIPLAFLSRALNKRAARLGFDMTGLLSPLVEDGTLGFVLTKRGGYMVYPKAEVLEEYGEDGLSSFLASNGMKR